MKNLLYAIVIAFCATTLSFADDCSFSLKVNDSSGSGYAEAVADSFSGVMALNGCAKLDEGAEYAIEIDLTDLHASKKLNPLGMAVAGGLSSARKVRGHATISVKAKSSDDSYSSTTETAPPTHEFFSGWRKPRDIKKRAAQEAAVAAALSFLKEDVGVSKPVRTKKPVSDIITEDRDLWPILGAGLTDIAIHESGHFVNARLTGHRAHFQGNDSRTFNAGPDLTLGFSVLFAHHMNEDQLLPLLPDVLYDFSGVETANGVQYYDNDGNPITSHGSRDQALIAYSGIFFQNMTNEYILTKHPNLINEDKPFLKGMFLMNVLLPAFYTTWGSEDPNSDLKLLRQGLEADKWQVNAMVLVPSAVDVYRYYHPEKKKLKTWARVAKLIPLAICLSQ